MFARINTAAAYLNILGLGWLAPLARIAAGDSVKPQLKELRQGLLVPLIGIGVFLAAWAWAAPQVKTSLGAIPGAGRGLGSRPRTSMPTMWPSGPRRRRSTSARSARNAKVVAEGHPDDVKHRSYTGKPTYLDQIFTSLFTVSLGFMLATLIAVPLGISAASPRP